MNRIHLTWQNVLVAASFAQWLVFALRCFTARATSKKLMRPADRQLLFSSLALLVAWSAAFAPPLLATRASSPKAIEASAAGNHGGGSCAMIQVKDSAAQVEAKLGNPDEKRDDAAVRGPGATTWVYRDGRCAVHVLDGQVDFVE